MSIFNRRNIAPPDPNDINDIELDELEFDDLSSDDFFSPDPPSLLPFFLVLAIIALCSIVLITFANKRISTTEENLINLHAQLQSETSTGGHNAQLLPIDLSSPVSLVDPIITAYMDSQPGSAAEILDSNRANIQRDVSNNVVLPLQVTHLSQGCTVADAVVDLSTDILFRTYRSYKPDLHAMAVELDFLNTNTQYYYRIHVALSDGTLLTTGGQFTTADTPRFLHISGAYNVRDIGGWKTTDGQRIRQGLLFRGTELDGAVVPDYRITEKGRQDMLTILGIRTDLDLRNPSVNGENILGVSHSYYDSPAYEGIYTSSGQSSVRRIFSELADTENYPIYLHCTYGLDRTGTICYLLEALLGVAEDDLLRDYELSTFGYMGAINPDSLASIPHLLDSCEGTTTQEKAENFLLSCGVTQTEIDSIRAILLEE